jgi:hypothetical protein
MAVLSVLVSARSPVQARELTTQSRGLAGSTAGNSTSKASLVSRQSRRSRSFSFLGLRAWFRDERFRLATASINLTPRVVAHYRAHLNEGRDEGRRSLELLSNRQLAEDIARTRRELGAKSLDTSRLEGIRWS